MTTTVHVISHTHWDREWYLTFEQYRARLIDLVDAVLDRMERDARFTFFHLDGQSIVLEDYLEIRPEREAEIRRRVKEGRLLVGPWFVMPDMFLVSGESLVRNLTRGIRTADAFGGSMRVGYIPDPFGHISQMPQILSGMGLEGAILWRGFGGRGAEYRWRSPDGTEVLLSHLPPDGYCNGLRLPLVGGDELRRDAAAILDYEQRRSRSHQILLMVGVDHVEPHPRLMDVVDVINQMPGMRAGISTLAAFVHGVQKDIDIAAVDVIDGELRAGQDYAHLLPGVFSARTYLKKANARSQRELEQWAEPLAVMAALSGADAQHGTFAYAWRTLLQNHPHDSICGCSIDAVHDENMTRFAKVDQVIAAAADRSIQRIASRVPPAPSGALRTMALNTSVAAWQGVFETDIDLPIGPATGFKPVDYTVLEEPVPFLGDDATLASVTDADGKELPFQVLSTTETVDFRMSRFAPPPGLRVKRMRIAVDAAVPPMGYAVLDFHVDPHRRPVKGRPTKNGGVPESPDARPVDASAGARAVDASVGRPFMGRRSEDDVVDELGDSSVGRPVKGRRREDAPTTANDFVRVDFANGAATILDKRTGVEYAGVFLLEDAGDVGDEYNYSPPATDERVTSASATDVRVRAVDDGPLTTAIEVSYTLDVPESAAADRRSRSGRRSLLACVLQLRIRRGSGAVECRLRITNTARDHRLRVLCATGASRVEHHRSDTAFDVITRPSAANGELTLEGRELAELPVATAPMQSFVDAGDEARGAVVVADGLPEFEVVHAEHAASIAVTLLRCVGDLSRDDLSTRRGHAGPGLSTPGAQCPGTHEFALTFVPRGTPPGPASLYALARAALLPPRVHQAAAGDGSAPARHSFMAVEAAAENAPVLSACKLADDRRSAIMRFFNPSDAAATGAALVLPPLVAAAYSTDLLERRGERRSVSSGRMPLDIPPHKIATVELVLPERGRMDA